MKKSLSILAISLLLAFSAQADEAHHPEKPADAPVVAKAKAPTSNEAIGKMQINGRKMRSQLVRIAKSKDDEVRQQLLVQYMQTMQENMMLAKGMMSGSMECPMMGMKGGMMMQHGSESSAGHEEMMKQMDKPAAMPDQ